MGKNQTSQNERVLFTKEMKKDYTILIPNMAPLQFELLGNVLRSYDYKVEILKTHGDAIVRAGLRYVHNDTCYPALLVIGQFIDALDSGKYDIHHTALMITQTGGGCRASNYIHLLRKALEKAGYGFVPVISVNVSGLEKQSGFSVTLPMLRRVMASLIYGDALMFFRNQIRPYENRTGETDELVERWVSRLSQNLSQGKGCSVPQVREAMKVMAEEFDAIPRTVVPKVKVGVVGEIYVKYSPLGNNNLEAFLAEEGCEVSIPGIMGFIYFVISHQLEDHKLYGGNFWKTAFMQVLMNYYLKFEQALVDACKGHKNLRQPSRFAHTKELGAKAISLGNKMGEGWLLTAEMLELVEDGFENIICAQPFGCLPNHICGKGMIRKVSEIDERANIVPIDYDPSATQVNQENRIKLMLAVAREKLEGEKRQQRERELREMELQSRERALQGVAGAGA